MSDFVVFGDLKEGDLIYLCGDQPLVVMAIEDKMTRRTLRGSYRFTEYKLGNLITGEVIAMNPKKESDDPELINLSSSSSKTKEYVVIDRAEETFLSLCDPVSGNVREDVLFQENLFANSDVISDSLEMGLECTVVVFHTKGDKEVVVSIQEERRQPNIKGALR
mmetsp:Transcript_35186/g.48064  ORF Transcript_35186/g.48064 Transcript_35186/m.48064 type:complete len:164 (+) Transcript_35186:57-548(+)